MQIGKKVVKVQKIVMTKAELEEMTKKGLVEMKVRIRPNLSHVIRGDGSTCFFYHLLLSAVIL